MARGPGLYTDVGKKARDILYRDFQSDHKFTVTTYSPNGVAITTSGTKKGDLLLAHVSTKLVNKNITTDIKVDTNSNVLTTVTVDEPTPGLKAILSFVLPYQTSGKVEFQYLHEYAGTSTSVGLTASPIVNLSGVVGWTFDCNLSSRSNKGESFTASYYHIINPQNSTAVGGELTHNFSSNENTLTIGTSHAFDPLTLIKSRVNNFGKGSALIQHEWRPKSLFTISAEVDTRAIEKSTKVGLALALRP